MSISLIFMGTPDFAVSSLKALYEKGFEIKAVVTQPDKERGRGKNISFTPVKKTALALGLPILQPVKMRDNNFINEIKAINADIFVVVAFRILPSSVLDIPHLGSINLHASLLPQYRGAAPINHALFNGEKETGATVFFLNKGVDTGEIISSRSVAIEDSDDYGSLYDKLASTGAELLVNTVGNIFDGNYTTRPQEKGEFRMAPKIGPEDFIINWDKSSEYIYNKIRGLSPKPGASSSINDKRIKIISSFFDNLKCNEKPGTIIEADRKKGLIRVATGAGTLIITKVQLESRPVTEVGPFLNGNRIEPGARFI